MTTRPAPIEPAPTAFSQTIGIDEDGDAPSPFGFAAIAGGPAATATIRARSCISAVRTRRRRQRRLFNFGPDGPAAIDPIVFDIAALNALGLTSGGQPIRWSQNGDDSWRHHRMLSGQSPSSN